MTAGTFGMYKEARVARTPVVTDGVAATPRPRAAISMADMAI
jgi:hypothetical protein